MQATSTLLWGIIELRDVVHREYFSLHQYATAYFVYEKELW